MIACDKRWGNAAPQGDACEIVGEEQVFSKASGVRHVLASLSLALHEQIDYSPITSHHSLAKAFGIHSFQCGCSSMVERQLPKLHTRVRFPSPADCLSVGCSALDACSRKPSELSVSGLIREQTERPKANVQDQTPSLYRKSANLFPALMRFHKHGEGIGGAFSI